VGLADWCREHDLRELAIERAKHALSLESGNPKAIELLNSLGLFLLDGTWLTEAEYCAKTGKVRYKDRLLSPAEVEAAKAKDEADEAARAAQSAANSAGTKSERLASDIAAADKQLKTLEEAKTKVGADASQAAATQERYTALERDLTNAQNKANAEKKDGGKVTQGTQNEVSNAQARMDKERAANREASRTKETATAKLAALDKQIAALKSKRQDLTEQKVAADKAAAEKKAAADKAASDAKAAADAKPAPAPAP
jgi:colicin import membrane protein